MRNPSLELFCRVKIKADWGQALRRPKKIPFPSTFPPNQEGNTFSEKYIFQICSSPCPQGRQQSTAVAADPQSPHPLTRLPTPTTPPTCLNPILPLPPSRYHPKVLATEPPSFMVVKYRGPDSHAKGRFPGIYASNVSCWHHSAGTHRKGRDMLKFLQPRGQNLGNIIF